MSTIVEPVVAHDEKSIYFIFFPEIAYGDFFFLEIYYKPAKKSKIRYGPSSAQKHAKFSD